MAGSLGKQKKVLWPSTDLKRPKGSAESVKCGAMALAKGLCKKHKDCAGSAHPAMRHKKTEHTENYRAEPWEGGLQHFCKPGFSSKTNNNTRALKI